MAEMKQKITRYSTAEPEKVASLLAKWLLNGM
jgi:flagellar biosynthesis/type III secretory pathway M-ring protein FliF/YscJ